MIKENIIMFGYGTVATGSFCGLLRFEWIKPPQENGKNLLGVEDIEFLKRVQFKYDDDVFKLNKELKNITKENNKITFRGYVLDFSNYDERSVQAVKRAVDGVIKFILPTLAC